MKYIGFILSVVFVSLTIYLWWPIFNFYLPVPIYGTTATLNMSNTVSPIIQKIGESACGYENIQFSGPDEWAKGGALIYKREPIATGQYEPGMGCINNEGNVYYIRCYEWTWIDDVLWYKPTHDIPLNVYSCIDESHVDIPYHNRKLQEMELGVKYIATK